MSWETQAWAGKQRPGSASAKLVLLGLASCADANHCAYPSIDWLCDFGDLNRKTVIAALQRLEEGMFPLIEDTGERRGRTGQVKVYRLSANAAGAGDDPASETVPKTEQFQNRNSSVFGRKESQKRDTEPFLEPKPPLPAKAGKTPAPDFDDQAEGGEGQASAPAGTPAKPAQPPQPAQIAKPAKRTTRGTRLADDWTPPPVADLPPMARTLVEQWPAGAYQAVCETFRLHWHTENRAIAWKRDWDAALGKWLISDHSKIMRDAKAGISFAHLAPASPAAGTKGGAKGAKRPSPVAAKGREDGRSAAMHAALRRELGDQLYQAWLADSALIHDAPGVIVIAPSEFQRSWIEDRFQEKVQAAARAVIGSGVRWIRFQVEQQTSKGHAPS